TAAIETRLMICLGQARSIANQPAGGNELGPLIDRGDRVAPRERNDLVAAAREDRVRADEDCRHTLLGELRKYRIDLSRAAGFHEDQLAADLSRRLLQLLQLDVGVGTIRIDEGGDDSSSGGKLVQDFQPFPIELDRERTNPGDIPARPTETLNKPVPDRFGR